MGSQIRIWSAQNILTDVIVLVYYVYSMYISCEMVGFVIRSTDIVLSFKHNFNLFLKEAAKRSSGGGGHLGKGGCANVLPDIRDKREPSQSPCRKGGFCISLGLVINSTQDGPGCNSRTGSRIWEFCKQKSSREKCSQTVCLSTVWEREESQPVGDKE